MITSLENRLERYIDECLFEQVFPGIAIGISYMPEKRTFKKILTYGKIDNFNTPVTSKIVYDCASLTKPLVTALSVLLLVEQNRLRWNNTLEELISYPLSPEKKRINLIHLMSHSSGFPAHRHYFYALKNIVPELRMKTIIQSLLEEKLEYNSGEHTLYSDLGYILLGYIIEKISGKKLEDFWLENFSFPLLLHDRAFFQRNKKKRKYTFAPTGFCPMTNEELTGVVHDDNCRMLGGVAGHAGLFGTIEGILSLCEFLLKGYLNLNRNQIVSSDGLRYILKKLPGSSWTLGFDTPSAVNSSSGRYFSSNSVGHLGFTGTSFWIDLEKRIIVVCLSNRVFLGAENVKIRQARPIIHDIIMEEMNNFFSINITKNS